MTNHWVDIKNTDLVLIMGGNAAEAHPCGFKWVTEAKAHRKARLIVVDPRFTRSAAVSDFYAPIRPGTDIAFLGGVINYLLGNDKIHHEYVKNYTDFSFLVKDEFALRGRHLLRLQPGEAQLRQIHLGLPDRRGRLCRDRPDPAESALRLPVDEGALSAATRRTWCRNICGTPKDAFLKVCEMIAETSAPDKTMTIMYALGWTQHSQSARR